MRLCILIKKAIIFPGLWLELNIRLIHLKSYGVSQYYFAVFLMMYFASAFPNLA